MTATGGADGRHGARYIVGIDLGTTNSVLAWVDTEEGEAPAVRMLSVPQLVRPGVVEERSTLPSFLYLASPAEFPEGALELPWISPASKGAGEGETAPRDYAVGELARAHGWQVPMRLVSSAKSWLSHGGVDRVAPILPPSLPGAEIPAEVSRVSPVEASARYLAHLRDAWNHLVGQGDPALALEKQDLFLTVPASFDAVARELTVRAAAAAGLEVTLLEEPQAAFYSWLAHTGDAWRKQLRVGDLVLVCDIGGGTTDFSLIGVSEQDGNLELSRLAVGAHILLGGDNMDLALSATLRDRLAREGHTLDAWQVRSLHHACRAAKEALLGDATRTSHPVTVLGRGRSVIGKSIKTELRREDVEALLLDGFFPPVGRDERPRERRRAGLVELGLPFASDAGITRHLAGFLGQHAEGRHPTAVLFNGGVMKGDPLRARVLETLSSWNSGGVGVAMLGGTDYDLAVAHGAAYYGMVRRGRGVRIRGGTARSYWIGIEGAAPAVPGMEPPLRAVCVAPAGMEEGTEADVVTRGVPVEFGLLLGERAEFRLLSSTTRKHDQLGAVIEEVDPSAGLEETAPLEAELAPQAGTGESVPPGSVVPVRLRTRVTEVGTLEVWCVGRDQERWKLEFDLRASQP